MRSSREHGHEFVSGVRSRTQAPANWDGSERGDPALQNELVLRGHLVVLGLQLDFLWSLTYALSLISFFYFAVYASTMKRPRSSCTQIRTRLQVVKSNVKVWKPSKSCHWSSMYSADLVGQWDSVKTSLHWQPYPGLTEMWWTVHWYVYVCKCQWWNWHRRFCSREMQGIRKQDYRGMDELNSVYE